MTDRSSQAIIARITNLAVPAWFAHARAGTSAVSPPHPCFTCLRAGKYSLHGTTLLDWLCRQLREPRHDLQSSAAEAFGHIGQVAAHSHTVLTALGDTIQGQDTFVAAKAVEALRRMGSVATRHSSILRILCGTALTTSDWFVRAGILRVFQQMGSTAVQGAEILPMFVAALHNEQASVRANAVEVLGQLPLSATQILTVREALVGLLDDQQEQDESVRTEAKTALDHLNQTAVGPVATPPISSGQRLRSNARQETDALFALVTALQGGEIEKRRAAAQALGQAGAVAVQEKAVVPMLSHALYDEDSGVRAEAARALGQIGDRAAQSSPTFSQTLSNSPCTTLTVACVHPP